jgi:hypothetical protein
VSGYGALATEVYDAAYPIGTSFGDVEYYQQLLTGTTGRVLEPAVGTGRILIPLLEAGLVVDGYDSSAPMVDLCRRHCEQRGLDPVIEQGDMTTFAATEAYAAVIVPTGSIALLDANEALTALVGFHDCLSPSGRLIVDLPAPRLITEIDEMRSWGSGSTAWTLQTMHIEYDRTANQTTRWLRYEKWSDEALLDTALMCFRLQQYSLGEFTDLLSEAGFSDISVTADYEDKAPEPQSDDWTFTAVRR